jgi:Putative zinc-finger
VTCDQTRELLEAYALGVLDGTERARVEEHLSSCESCSAVVARYSEVLAGLPDALALASRLQLPGAIKQRLLARIKAGATVPAEPSPSAAPGQSRRRRVRRLLVLAGAVVLALASTAALSFALDHERQLKERFAGLLDQREVVLDVVDGRGTERAFLRSPVEGSTAYGKLFTNPGFARCRGHDRPATEAGRRRALPRSVDDRRHDSLTRHAAGELEGCGVRKLDRAGCATQLAVRNQLICRHDSVRAPHRLRRTVRPSAVRNITLFPPA